ncbi:template-activating factor I [Mytilus galloprovincialis]|uniref:Template-activating factor I n=1 Tax=Mytilus galloprovincialis TaxID=29158 RepID=A0A8B6DC85_MYTGA|nr:template-activating factor I [Mytilus galloprovincialis]
MANSEETAQPLAKVQKLSETMSDDANDVEQSLDFYRQKALEDIDGCQNKIDALNEKASEEILQVEQKYNKLRKPHYEQRNELIKNIPNFWVTAFVNHPQISAVLEDVEEDCLHYLSKLEVEEFEDIKSGYKISFVFASNPYFSNTVLVKEFHLSFTGDPTSKSSKIEWKNGMDISAKIKQNGNNRKRKRGQSRSFFQWFEDNTDPSADDIAEVVKDDMWPNPLQYYLASDIEVENGISDDDDDDMDDSVVVLDEDDDDEDEDGDQEDEVYEVLDDDDENDEEVNESIDDDDVEVLDDIEEEIADDDVEEVNLDDSEEIDEDILDNSGGEGDSNGLIEIKPNQSEKPTDSKPSENVTDEQSNKKDSSLEESNKNTEEKTQNESESKTK